MKQLEIVEIKKEQHKKESQIKRLFYKTAFMQNSATTASQID